MAGTELHKQFANGEDVDEEGEPKHPLAEAGFLSMPSVDKHGGIVVGGPILHLVHVSLRNIRNLIVPKDDDAKKTDDKKTLTLRRYILGLSLFEMLAPADYSLRSGCQLFPTGEPAISLLPERVVVKLDVDEIYEYTKRAAADFGVNAEPKKFLSNEELIRRRVEELAAKKANAAKEKEAKKNAAKAAKKAKNAN